MAIFNLPISRVGDSNFRVGSGYKLYFYEAGTTTLKDTYTSNTYATANSNPVVADASGYFSVIWTSGDYKVRLYTDANVLVWEVDNYSNDNDTAIFAEGVLTSPGSAANVITASLDTTPGTLSDQLQVVVELQHGANTTATPTFNLNSLGAKTIKRDDAKALFVGDTGGSGYKIYLSYSSANDCWIILNPANTNRFGLGLEWKNGLLINNNGSDADHDIDIATGSIMDSTNVIRMNLNTAITKRIDATWAAGTAAGGLSDDDTLGNDTWYGVFLLGKANGDTDVIFATTKAKSLSDAAATAAGFVYSRLIGHVLTDGSANIYPFFYQGSNEFRWKDQKTNLESTPSTAGTSTPTYAPPLSIGVLSARLTTDSGGSGAARFVKFSVNAVGYSESNNAADAGNSDIACESDGTIDARNDSSMRMRVALDSSIRYRCSHTANTTVRVNTLGWVMDWNILDLV
jgi:hypothetical protein